jgi:hypothetical protein
MGIDKAGQDGGTPQFKNDGFRWYIDLLIGPHTGDAAILDDHHGIFNRFRPCPIDEPAN